MSNPTSSSKLPLLQANPLAEDVRRALSSYLSVAGLVNARPGDEWTVRPLPSTGRRKDAGRLFTVNVSNMETLYAYFNPITGEEVGGRLHVWHELDQSLPRLAREFEIGELEEIEHRTAASHARAIYFLDLKEAGYVAGRPRDSSISCVSRQVPTKARPSTWDAASLARFHVCRMARRSRLTARFDSRQAWCGRVRQPAACRRRETTGSKVGRSYGVWVRSCGRCC